MGAVNTVVSAMKSSSATGAKQVQAQLEMLGALATAKKKEQIALIDESVEQAAENNDIQPLVKVYQTSEVHVMSSTGPAAGINGAVDGLLNGAQKLIYVSPEQFVERDGAFRADLEVSLKRAPAKVESTESSSPDAQQALELALPGETAPEPKAQPTAPVDEPAVGPSAADKQ